KTYFLHHQLLVTCMIWSADARVNRRSAGRWPSDDAARPRTRQQHIETSRSRSIRGGSALDPKPTPAARSCGSLHPQAGRCSCSVRAQRDAPLPSPVLLVLLFLLGGEAVGAGVEVEIAAS